MQTHQQAVSKEKLVKSSEHYKKQYKKTFVEKWDDLIDWDGRAESEGTFFMDILKRHNAKDVIDVATGTGFHSVRLKKAGFNVLSVDGSENMLDKASENAEDRGLELTTQHSDWRHLSKAVGTEQADAIVCLGNSFTHLFSHDDRMSSLKEFFSVLKPGGILILDQRNYDSILDEGYNCSGKHYYCGEDVCVAPIFLSDDLTRFSYKFSDDTEYFLNMFPLRREYLRGVMKMNGFRNIETFGDFREDFNPNDADFLIHVAQKPKS